MLSHCELCGGRGADGVVLGRHHIIPREHGGQDHAENIVTLCESCHNWAELNLVAPEIVGRAAFWRMARLICPLWRSGVVRRRTDPRLGASWSARRRRRKTPTTDQRKCAGCKKELRGKRPDARFCSESCRYRSWALINRRGLEERRDLEKEVLDEVGKLLRRFR